jgi:signal peptidase II
VARLGRVARLAGILGVVAFTIGCDRITKDIAARELAARPRASLIGDLVRLEYVENGGGFLSLGADLPEGIRASVFGLGTAVLLLWLSIVLGRRVRAGRWALGPALLWAGGFANLVDRVSRGSVIDFLNVGVGWLRTGVFNVADMAISLGAALILMDIGRRRCGSRGTPR